VIGNEAASTKQAMCRSKIAVNVDSVTSMGSVSVYAGD